MTEEKTFTIDTHSPQTVIKDLIQICEGREENELVTFDNDFVRGLFKYVDYPDKMVAIMMNFYSRMKVNYHFSSTENNEKWMVFMFSSQSCILFLDKIKEPFFSHNNGDAFMQMQKNMFSWQPSFDTDAPVKLIVAYIHPSWLEEIGITQNPSSELGDFFNNTEPVKFIPIARHLLVIVEQIFDMIDKNDNQSLANKIIESYLWALVSDTLYQFINFQQYKEKQVNNSESEDVRQQIMAARDEMLRDFSKSSLDLDYLAKFAGMNRTKFQQAFKDIFNISFYRYYQEARFNEAIRLLEFENYTTTAVAVAVGYKNVGYFIKEFQKRFGMTPNEYKMKNLK